MEENPGESLEKYPCPPQKNLLESSHKRHMVEFLAEL